MNPFIWFTALGIAASAAGASDSSISGPISGPTSGILAGNLSEKLPGNAFWEEMAKKATKAGTQTPDALEALLPKLCFRRYLPSTRDAVSDAVNTAAGEELLPGRGTTPPMPGDATADVPFCYLTPFGRGKVAVPLLFASLYQGERWGLKRVADVKTHGGRCVTRRADLVCLCESTEIVPVSQEHLDAWQQQYPGCLILHDDGQQTLLRFGGETKVSQ